MAGWRAVNIATITEEKVEGEEVGEDGMVETITSAPKTTQPGDEEGCPPQGAQDGGTPGHRLSLERPSSLVEKEEPEDNSSILSAINFDGDSPSVAIPRRTTPPRTPPLHTRAASPRRKNLSRRGTRATGFTMNLSDKFVTELSLYDPSGSGGPLQTPVLLLGLFLATDQLYGDHSVYKVSPVSPLAALKIKAQDRLLKINEVSLAGWSHSCVIDYVKNLSLAQTSEASTTSSSSSSSPDTPTDLRLSLEIRGTVRCVRSPEETPRSRILETTLRIRRKRATVIAVQEREVRMSHRFSLSRSVRAARAPLHLATSLNDGGVPSLVVVGGDRKEACFLFHTFDVSPAPAAGEEQAVVAVVEADAPRSWYLHAASTTSVTLMYSATLEVQTLTAADVRFFSLHKVSGDHLYRIQSLATGSFLSVAAGSVGLVARQGDAALPDTTLFQLLPY